MYSADFGIYRNYNVERGIPGSEMHIHGMCLTIRNRFRLLPEILFQFLATETSDIKQNKALHATAAAPAGYLCT